MSNGLRMAVYCRQNGYPEFGHAYSISMLTPRQRRRYMKHSNREAGQIERAQHVGMDMV